MFPLQSVYNFDPYDNKFYRIWYYRQNGCPYYTVFLQCIVTSEEKVDNAIHIEVPIMMSKFTEKYTHGMEASF